MDRGMSNTKNKKGHKGANMPENSKRKQAGESHDFPHHEGNTSCREIEAFLTCLFWTEPFKIKSIYRNRLFSTVKGYLVLPVNSSNFAFSTEPDSIWLWVQYSD